jgi:HlyD family secretion protein
VTFLTFCVLFFISYFIQYPDIIKAPIVLQTANPPIEMTASVEASILILYAANGQPVKKGDILGQLDGLANYNDIFFLEQILKEELSIVDQNSLLNFDPEPDLQLGIIQPFYTRFVKNFEFYQKGVSSNYEQQNIQSLNNQINSLQNAIEANNERKPILKNELITAEEAVKNIQKRYVNDSSVMNELETASFLVNSLNTELKNLDAENARKLADISNLQTHIKAIQAQSGTKNISSLVVIKSDISILLNEIEKWKNDNILVAPKDGVVVLADKIKEKQSVRKNEKILSIVPQDDRNFFGKVMLPIKGSGKVKDGQEVVIKFDNYPYQEYGIVKGVVKRKSILPNDGVQNIFVTLDKVLITSHNKELPYTPFMQGTAEIITKDRRLIERIFENVSALLEDY